MADKILVIERSATFRARLKKALAFSGRQIHTCELFQQATRLLDSNSAESLDYAAIIIGWPSYTDSAADSLLVAITQRELAHIPIIIFSEDVDPAKLDWITRRPHTALLAWDETSSATTALNTLANEAGSEKEEKAPAEQPRDRIKVLLVDDSPTIRHNFRLLLEKGNYEVKVASSVEEANEIAIRTNIDIAVIDYFMPDANGDILIKHLKSDPRTENIEIAVLTGGYSDQIIHECLSAGATECMFKNEGAELFLARVQSIARNVLHKRSIGRERNRLRQILAAVGDGVFGVDNTGSIQFINPAARKMLGYTNSDAIIGGTALKCIHHSNSEGKVYTEQDSELHQSYLNGTVLTGYETLFWSNDGTAFPVECTLSPIKYDDQTSGAIVAFRNISERLSKQAELEWQASHDPLTQLMNREAFEQALTDEVDKLKENNNQSALMVIDVDRFRYINDTGGHDAGDRILVEICKRLISQLGEFDRIARVSGDEFAIILSNIDPSPEKVLESADRFREVIECQKFYVGKTSFASSITAGITMLDKHTKSVSESMSKANQACNLAKTRGRNCIHIYNSIDDHAGASGEDLVWLTRLRDALVWNRFQVQYQPIIAVNDMPDPWIAKTPRNNWSHWSAEPPNRFEALVRLRDIDGKLIYPDAFLPLAERFDLIGKIDRWVIEDTFKTIASRNWPELEVYINMSVITLMSPDIDSFISDMIEKTGLDPTSVVFEITESSAVRNIRQANRCIGRLRDLGLRFALDDFGSGYSSFYHLKNLDVDIIKIDGIFTQEINRDTMDKSVLLSINEVAHSLGKKTVVEHVDRPEVLRALVESSVDYMQGFLLSEPLEKLPNRLVKNDGVLDLDS